jgi:hypothetical protein
VYYLEIKLDRKIQVKNNNSNFISNIIETQNNLDKYEIEKLLLLGFVYNPSTNRYKIQEKFNIKQLTKLTQEVSKIDKHKLIHGFTELKIYNNELYFWDKSLIYEGMDTFEYCLKYHNILSLKELTVLTKLTSINEDLLNLVNYTRRYSSPTTEFTTQNCLWDKKEAQKILNDFVENKNQYILINEANEYKL